MLIPPSSLTSALWHYISSLGPLNLVLSIPLVPSHFRQLALFLNEEFPHLEVGGAEEILPGHCGTEGLLELPEASL